MLVREIVDSLRQLEDGKGLSGSQQDAVNQLVTILAPHQDMELEAFFDLLRRGFKPKRRARGVAEPTQSSSAGTKQSADEFASALRSAFNDDASFAALINDAKANRSLTLSALKSCFADLFGRSGNFRAKATRADVLRKILDERNIQVRNEKMGQMLGRRAVPAE